MGNSGSLILEVNNKALYQKNDGSYIWVVKNGDRSND